MDYLCEHLTELQLIAIWAGSVILTNTFTYFLCKFRSRNRYNRI